MSDRIEKTMDLRAPVDRVWLALTDHVEFGAWFRVVLDAPFALNAVSTGHIAYPGYEHLKWEARIVAMDAPRLFAFTWHPYAIDPAVDYADEPPTRVEFRLEPIAGGTRLTITESGFGAIPAARRDEAMRMNGSGWNEQADNIRRHVER
jgi:uncharacterized protein YndB with AHSA1/START domain